MNWLLTVADSRGGLWKVCHGDNTYLTGFIETWKEAPTTGFMDIEGFEDVACRSVTRMVIKHEDIIACKLWEA